MPSAIMHTHEIAEEYLAAGKQRDVKATSRLLHPDVRLKSPVADLTGRESFPAM